ncbi:hypothetical protein LK10_10890 [Sinomonas humi]|uniref:Uncharacterized protein n=1 Tax=Sinomonas humi TaxID=1338436 RepID=A0A0B2AM09_9MICC|nr:hypothetical protein LK10_10890 [Sinomonas humi]
MPGDFHGLVLGERLGAAELDHARWLGLKRDCRDEGCNVVGGHEAEPIAALADDQRFPAGHVEPAERAEVDLLEGVGTDDDLLHRRAGKEILGRLLGVLQSKPSRGRPFPLRQPA